MLNQGPENSNYLTVSQLVADFNRALENFGELRFSAEVSQVTRAGSGHLYLALKDDKSQIRAVMWRGMAEQIKFKLEAGLHINCHGRPAVYGPTGNLQIVLNRVELAGEGALQKKFLELKAKLEKEGLFDASRKRPLPFFPRAIGVVTSKTGAVIHDIMVKIRERMPSVEVYLHDVRVQGEGAAEEISAAVKALSESGLVEVVIVARGGGSLEDLWAFNEEKVVRAIFAAKVPVVSGVGHEVDITLCDLAADVRAPTPTAAAEMVVPSRLELTRRVLELEKRLTNFETWLGGLNEAVDNLDQRLGRALQSNWQSFQLNLDRLEARLASIRPDKLLSNLLIRVDGWQHKLQSYLERLLVSRTHALEQLHAKLETLSPLKVLERGYALVEKQGGIIRSIDQIETGDTLNISLWSGGFEAGVKEIYGKRKIKN